MKARAAKATCLRKDCKRPVARRIRGGAAFDLCNKHASVVDDDEEVASLEAEVSSVEDKQKLVEFEVREARVTFKDDPQSLDRYLHRAYQRLEEHRFEKRRAQALMRRRVRRVMREKGGGGNDE